LAGELPAQWEKVVELITSPGFSLKVADVGYLREANGITDWQNREVVVRDSLPGAQRFKTAVHELAHIQLHEPMSGSRPNRRGIVEVEAESVAYMVCAALGVDSADYSLPYVATWSGGDLQKVSATAERVIRCARQVLAQLQPEQGLTRDVCSPEITAIQDRQPAAIEKRHPDRAQNAPPEGRTEELEEALRVAISFYHERLDHRDGAEARTFLQDRGFHNSTVARWQLGYAPAAWDALVKELRSQQIPDEVLLEAGLAGRARTGRLYDRMRGRVVFPILDAQGSQRGFAGRHIAGDGPKYLNSPETPLYKKSELLYGLNHATSAIARSGRVVVVEGYTDAIASHQAGITNTVATGGTALTPQHIEMLRPIASGLTLAFDADQGGLQAVQRVAELPKPALSDLSLQVAYLMATTPQASSQTTWPTPSKKPLPTPSLSSSTSSTTSSTGTTWLNPRPSYAPYTPLHRSLPT
jgi:hypothetical protein